MKEINIDKVDLMDLEGIKALDLAQQWVEITHCRDSQYKRD